MKQSIVINSRKITLIDTYLQKFLVLILLSVISVFTYAQVDGDRIIAIVGNEIITQSDLNTQLLIYARENRIQPTNQVAGLILENMINENLILARAEQDSIFVSEEEVNKQVEFRYQQILTNVGSEKNLQELYGYRTSEIKEILRKDFRRKMIIDRYKQQKFGFGINVTKKEVLDFFNKYKDSIPTIPEEYELYAIARKPEKSEEAKRMAYSRAQDILDSIKTSGDFSRFARLYSEDSVSALQGGNLGKVRKGNLVKEFEDAAFVLNKGEISNIIETQYGYHIIKLNDKSGDIIDVSHILIRIPNLPSADNEAIRFLKDLKSSITNLTDFKKAAISYSHDQTTAKDSGYIGRLNIYQLDSTQILGLHNLSTGQVSEPLKYGDDMEYYYTIFYINDKISEHTATIEGDFKIIENMARNEKENKMLQEWYTELKKTVFVEKKINF